MVGAGLLQWTVILEAIVAQNKFSGLKNRIFATFGPIDSVVFNKSLHAFSYRDTNGNNVVVVIYNELIFNQKALMCKVCFSSF